MTKFVTVIVPVRNEATHIAATLKQLLNQRYPPGCFEVLVIDGRSTDATVEIVRGLLPRHPQLQLFDNPKRLASAGRNVGVQHARGEYIVIVDGHCEIRNENYLGDLVSAFEQSGIECLGRPQPLEISGATLIQRGVAVARASRLGHHPASYIYSSVAGPVKPQSVAIAYRKSVFDRVGLFDERFDACEDVEFNHRVDHAGFQCWLVPELAVHYRPRASFAALFKQMKRYGRGRVQLLRKHPDMVSIAVFAPAFFFASLAALALLGFAWPTAAICAGWIVSLYLVTITLAGLLAAARKRDVGLALVLPVALATIHAGAAWGVASESHRAIVRWIKKSGRTWWALNKPTLR